MDITEKKTQVQNYTDSLDAVVVKIEQNEIDAGSSLPMSTAPYEIRQELVLLRRNINKFIAEQLVEITRAQHEAGRILVDGEYKSNGVTVQKGEGQELLLLRWDVEDKLNSTEERFNTHLVNLRPMYYRNIPKPIVL